MRENTVLAGKEAEVYATIRIVGFFPVSMIRTQIKEFESDIG